MLRNWFKENKLPRLVTVALFLCLLLGWILFALFDHQLIEAMYEGRSIGFLNGIIEGQATHPVEYYFENANKLFIIFQLILLVIIFALFSGHIKSKFKTMAFFIFMYGLIYLFSYNLSLRVSLDSTNYLSCSEHLLRGEGFYSTGFDQAKQDEYIRTGIRKASNNEEIHPYTHWGPLYPMLLSLLMRIFNTYATAAALIVNRAFFALLITLIYIILVQTEPIKLKFSALIVAGLLIFFNPFSMVFGCVWTEITYTGLSVSAAFLLQNYYKCFPEKEMMIISICAIVTSLCLLCKYIGITILLTGLILIVIKKGLTITKRKMMNCLIFSSISVLPLLPWLVRNVMLTGFLSGGNRGPSSMSVVDNFLKTGYTIAKDFPFITDKYILGFVLVFLFLVLLLFYINSKNLVCIVLKLLVLQHTAYIIYPIVYVASLIALASISHFDSIGTRLAMPMYPFIIIVGVGFLYHVFNNIHKIMERTPCQ
jgi:hypothetical protein